MYVNKATSIFQLGEIKLMYILPVASKTSKNSGFYTNRLCCEIRIQSWWKENC